MFLTEVNGSRGGSPRVWSQANKYIYVSLYIFVGCFIPKDDVFGEFMFKYHDSVVVLTITLTFILVYNNQDLNTAHPFSDYEITKFEYLPTIK